MPGADINSKDDYHQTALIEAIKNRHEEIAELLINAGADVTTKNNYGGTALYYAKHVGWNDIADLIEEKLKEQTK